MWRPWPEPEGYGGSFAQALMTGLCFMRMRQPVLPRRRNCISITTGVRKSSSSFVLFFLTFILFRFSDVEPGRRWGWVFPSETQWTQTKKSPMLPYSLLKYWFDHNILAHPALHRMYEQHCTSIYNQIFLSHKRRLCTFPPACFRRTAPFFFLFCTEGQEIRTKAKRCRDVELQPQSSKVCLAR